MISLLKRVRSSAKEPEPLAAWCDLHSLAQFYPSRDEIEAAWDRGEAPPFGMCHPCGAVRPLEIDGSCSSCGATCLLAPRNWQKVNGRWIAAEGFVG